MFAVVGSHGFLGERVVQAATKAGHSVRRIGPWRGECPASSVQDLQGALARDTESVITMAREFAGVDVVLNCAGLASPASSWGPSLIAANSYLPGLLLSACDYSGVPRLVHTSSAAVQGWASPLTESQYVHPLTPYAASKAMAESLLTAMGSSVAVAVAVHRPTSVHGTTRETTRQLARFARSPLSSFAGRGDRPSPQVLVDNVAEALVFLASHPYVSNVPTVQPSEGMTTRRILTTLGRGRKPKSIPDALASAIVSRSAGLPGPWATSQSTRLRMLWFGQEQQDNWLQTAGFVSRRDTRAWRQLAEGLA